MDHQTSLHRTDRVDEFLRRRQELLLLRADALRLQRRMVAVRSRTRTRRSEVCRARERLREDLCRRRMALQTSEARAASVLLDSAARVSGMDPYELWLEYFALGGEATPEDLVSILDGDLPLYRLDHDRLVVAINERLTEQGAGRPLSFWDGSH